MKNKYFFSLPKNEKYLISVSGGVDSMTLLHLLEKEKYSISVVHFNHQQRKESHQEYLMIKKYCENKNINFEYIILNFVSLKNFQATASKKRKFFLEKIATKRNIKNIVTAHHLNDQAENIFIKIIRGSNLQGYSGMNLKTERNDIIYHKPFLFLSKEKIRKIAKQEKIPFAEDDSNYKNYYLRNEIRNNFLNPLLKKRNFLPNIIRFSQQLKQINDFIKKESVFFLENIYKQKNNLKIFLQKNDVIQREIIAYLLRKKKAKISFNIISNILKHLKAKKGHIKIKINKKEFLEKKYNSFFFNKKEDEETKKEFVLKIQKINEEEKYILKKEQEIILNYNEENVNFPLQVIQRTQGEKLFFSFGRKKLSRFLIDKKIPLEKRQEIILISDQNKKILWIPNLYINKTLGDKKKVKIFLKKRKDFNIH